MIKLAVATGQLDYSYKVTRVLSEKEISKRANATKARERKQAAIALLKAKAEYDPVIEAMLVVLNLA